MLFNSLVVSSIYAIDQASKRKIEEIPDDEPKVEYLGGHIGIEKYHNTGLAFNFLEKDGKLPLIFSSVALFILGCAKLISHIGGRKKTTVTGAGLSFILGGALGNVRDRQKKGYVTDFITFPKAPTEYLRNMHFNIADFAIFFGVILTIIGALGGDDKTKQ